MKGGIAEMEGGDGSRHDKGWRDGGMEGDGRDGGMEREPMEG